MREISGLYVLAVLAFAGPALQAAAITGADPQITYNAVVDNPAVDCPQSPMCVTVSLEWVGLPTPVSFAVIEDNLGNTLFSLSAPFPGSATGSIVPDPQTISGLSPSEIATITNSQAVPAIQGVDSNALVTTGEPTYAILYLEDASHNDIAQVQFIATTASVGSSVPEPAAWSLFGTGLGLLFVLGWARRRKGAAVSE